jgi:CheY-like chemotaxis protein
LPILSILTKNSLAFAALLVSLHALTIWLPQGSTHSRFEKETGDLSPLSTILAAAAAASPATLAGRPPGILIVDDELAVRTLLDVALGRQGYRVFLASDGEEALALYRSHHEAIDLTLLDVRMPVLDGPQTLRALRQITPDIRCCMMSGQCGNYNDEELAAMGAAHLFKKPFRLVEIMAVIEHMTSPVVDSPRS